MGQADDLLEVRNTVLPTSISSRNSLLNVTLQHFLGVTAQTRVAEVIPWMSQSQTHCVLVVKPQELIGIVTEQDILRAIAQDFELEQLTVAQIMTQPVICVQESESHDVLNLIRTFRQYQIRHLPVLSHQGQILGVITPQQICEQIKPYDFLKLRRVAEVMQMNVVQATAETSLKQLACLMVTRQTSSVIITPGEERRDQLLGIVTERDLIQLLNLEYDFTQTPANQVMSAPLITIDPHESLWTAHQKMQQFYIRRLGVIPNTGERLGMLTETQFLQVLDPIERLEAIESLQQALAVKTAEINQEIHESRILVSSAVTVPSGCQNPEEILKFRHQQLEAIANKIPNGYVYQTVFHPDGSMTLSYMSASVFAVTELTPEYVRAYPHCLVDITHPEDQNRIDHDWREAITKLNPTVLEFRIMTASGQIKWVKNHSSFYRLENGDIVCESVVLDITEYKEVEVALRESEEDLQALFAAMSDLVLILDRQGRYLKILTNNPDTLYLPEAELLGKTAYDVFPKATADSLVGAIHQCLMTQQTVRIEYSLPIHEQETWFSANVSPLSANTVVWVVRDISDSKRIEAELRQYREHLEEIVAIRTNALVKTNHQLELEIQERQRVQSELRFQAHLLDVVEHAIITTDLQGLITYWNPFAERLYGWLASQVKGRNLFEILMAQIPLTQRAEIQSHLSRGERWSGEFEVPHREGRLFPVLMTYSPLYNDGGKLTGMVSISLDLTERQQVEEELKKANAELGIQVEEQTQNFVETLKELLREIIKRKKAEDALRLQAERERLITQITQRIRQTLELDEILNTTVREIRQVLKCDRVFIYHFAKEGTGSVIVESVEANVISLLGQVICHQCQSFSSCLESYQQSFIQNLEELSTANLTECSINILSQSQAKAHLVIPILQGEKLWGLLAAQHCHSSRKWLDWEVDLLKQLSTQVSIAIHQSQLYKQTHEQAQREKGLRRVIQAIRQSLELQTIFSTATAEISRLLQLDRVEIVQYQAEQKRWINVASYPQPNKMSSMLGLEIPEDGNLYSDQLKRGEIVRIENYSFQATDSINKSLSVLYPGAWLLVPLQVSSSIWGALSLSHSHQSWVWQDSEVELASTIADQLAIAIQQSQLYQQLQEANQRLEGLATLDSLTQIPNRRRFDDYLNQQWHHLAREQLPLSLILCDVDYFKRYNDTYGHQEGDQCLIQVAQTICQSVKRSADLTARYGGEEFGIILPNTDETGAIQVAQFISHEIQLLKIPHATSTVNHYVTVSQGIASWVPRFNQSPNILLSAADRALYRAKANGRNTYYIYDWG